MKQKNILTGSFSNTSLGILVLRVGVGLGMITHGYPKLEKLFGSEPIVFGDPIGIGAEASLVLTVFAEFICSILIVIGFKIRFASAVLFITMFVAFFIVHAQDLFKNRELAFLYLLCYLVLFFLGSGRYSLDGTLNKKKQHISV